MARIVVLGSLNMDLVLTVQDLPRPGETVLGRQLGRYPGGKGANQAVAAARLGGEVAMVGRVGGDSFGQDLVRNLSANGVDAAGVELDEAATTGAALIYVAADGQNMIAVAPGANGRLDASDARRAVALLRAGDVLVMQLEIPVTVIASAAHGARRAGALVVFNASPAQRVDSAVLSQLEALVVNEGEADVLVGQENSPSAAAAALRASGARIAIVTLGPAGSLFCDDRGVHRVEPFGVQATDSTGAGDAFMGALAVGIARRLATGEAVRFANAAGAAAATALGAQAALPRLDDLRRLFGFHVPSLEV